MKIDHIGIAVRDLRKVVSFYEEVLGLEKTTVEIVEAQGVKIAFFKLGESKIELLEPLTDKSPLTRFIDKRGEGIHHLAIRVEDIESKVAMMKEAGCIFIGERPTKGADGLKIIFVHPKSTNGVLLELCEPQ